MSKHPETIDEARQRIQHGAGERDERPDPIDYEEDARRAAEDRAMIARYTDPRAIHCGIGSFFGAGHRDGCRDTGTRAAGVDPLGVMKKG